MKQKHGTYSIRRLMRIMIVIIIYQYELFDKTIDSEEIFKLDKFNELFNFNVLKTKNISQIQKEQSSILSTIEKNYKVFKKTITNFIRTDWSWSRLNPLVRSILLCASVELWKLDVGIVANEYVQIAKDFIPDDKSYKFINIVIEEIGKKYNVFKRKSN
ncbi:MAG: transcription antitermination protein NusB [Mycoplasmataceae bacterium]|nr:transcription antitermination protein NusB [Mycoplasmataceae bacterium]